MAEGAATIIDAFNKEREPERLALKKKAMRQNVFSFYRGTAHLFWQRVAEAKVDATAPPAWCSGDLHLENFGTYLADNGLAYFDVNDFDEAAKAPCDWEILRLVTSIAIAAPSLAVSKTDAKVLMKSAADAYRLALQSGKARWIERRLATGAIDELIDGLKSRSQARLLDKRTVLVKGRRRLDVPSDRMLPVTEADRAKLEKFCTALGKSTGRSGYFTFIDGARRIAGTGSLGIARFVALIEGDGSPAANVLLDLKAASPSTLSPCTQVPQPKWASEADRVVTTQNRCQAVSPHLLNAVAFNGQSFVIKELQPTADRLDLARIAKQQGALTEAVQWMARLAAWAQLRSAGRDGSATPDDLIAFAREDAKFADRLTETARALAAITLADYKDYCTTLDQVARSSTKT